jgi:hypothetical protein
MTVLAAGTKTAFSGDTLGLPIVGATTTLRRPLSAGLVDMSKSLKRWMDAIFLLAETKCFLWRASVVRSLFEQQQGADN